MYLSIHTPIYRTHAYVHSYIARFSYLCVLCCVQGPTGDDGPSGNDGPPGPPVQRKTIVLCFIIILVYTCV